MTEEEYGLRANALERRYRRGFREAKGTGGVSEGGAWAARGREGRHAKRVGPGTSRTDDAVVLRVMMPISE